MRKIDASDNVYTTESTTGNLFSLTQEGAPLCRIIAKVSFLVDRPGESVRKLVWWEQSAQEAYPGSSICLLCDLGRITSPLWALLSPSFIVTSPSDFISYLRPEDGALGASIIFLHMVSIANIHPASSSSHMPSNSNQTYLPTQVLGWILKLLAATAVPHEEKTKLRRTEWFSLIAMGVVW